MLLLFRTLLFGLFYHKLNHLVTVRSTREVINQLVLQSRLSNFTCIDQATICIGRLSFVSGHLEISRFLEQSEVERPCCARFFLDKCLSPTLLVIADRSRVPMVASETYITLKEAHQDLLQIWLLPEYVR